MNQPRSAPRVRVLATVEGIPGTTLYQAVDSADKAIDGPRVAVIARTHGNEPVGDPVLALLAAEGPTRLTGGSVLAVRANLKAAELDVRHSPDGQDMNRLWDAATLDRLAAQPQDELDYEERRVRVLAPLLEHCDVVLDLHSTSRPSAPFLVFRDDQRHAAMARRLGVERLVTGLHENAILSGGVTSNIGLRTAERGPRLGFTFEAGQHTAPGNAERAWGVVERLLTALGVWRAEPGTQPEVHSQIFEVVDRVRQAPAGTEQYRFVGYDGGEPGGGRRAALRQLHSFEEVEADEVVLRRGHTEVVRAGAPFTMLMPAPDTEPDTDLYYVTAPRHGGLAEGEARTDGEARREALAIERMLDLLADDEFERGSTWVAFDARRLYDLSASIVGRIQRLPVEHPHRRITVMGRGDAVGGYSERRAGQRYRQAMRTAIAEGLPIERIQLLRGAPLRWIDAMTGPRMRELLLRRRERCGPNHPGIRMRVSLRQPHTASLLVAGDLAHAQQTGDTRHVRVALLIEAATVEAAGATAQVRVVRSGMVSSRSELVSAAAGVIEALRGEHKYQVRHGALREEPGLSDLLLPDDALETRGDPEAVETLRSSLYRVQLRLWCDQLLHELPEPVALPDDTALGRWTAQIMSATGILDADSLQAVAVRRDGSGWVADPARIHRLYERAHARPVDSGSLWSVGAPQAPVSPPVPLQADHVDADDLERWVGWKRFVRGVQVVPDTRGNDMDLAFSGGDIRGTLVRWLDRARELAAERPGDVMIVVAGDGLNPSRDLLPDTMSLLRSHRAALRDKNVQYLRIQHAQGTHLSWMKDFLHAVEGRPPDSRSVALQFEAEHGATVNAVLVLERDRAVPAPRPWSLDGWSLLASGVILSDLQVSGGEDYKVGMFTERLDGRVEGVNQELLHFGRAHCEGLLIQAGARVRADHGPPPTERFEAALIQQIARWIERVRLWKSASQTAPRDIQARGRWVAQRLGLADARLARALAREMDRDTPPVHAATRLWASVPPWPGPAYDEPVDALQ